ncbi:MAG: DUF4214 domain-containing protein, partial [Synechococcaceae bacterium WB9_2_112]|nr:DUF4214 domain-containing protein [Synechococcaceae bacterium WB9_2_112]
MAITVQMRTQVSQLYVALFGRAPDGDGLAFWVGRLDTLGGTAAAMTQIANDMFATAPARAYFPLFLTNREIISSFYVNVLGRAADTGGLDFWTAKLDARGATPGSVITEMISAVVSFPSSGSAEGVTSRDLFNNKVTVAQAYGEKNLGVTNATSILSGVTASTATVTAALNLINTNNGAPIGTGGQTFTLTTGVDSGAAFTGGAGNDTFNAALSNGAQTLNSSDSL